MSDDVCLLDRVDDIEQESFLKEEGVNGKPVVPGSFHTDFKIGGV